VDPKITNEMKIYFLKRTFMHIHRVHKAMLYLITECAEELELSPDDCKNLAQQVLKHDQSKFSQPQYESYILYSWLKNPNRKDDFELSDQQQARFKQAWRHHYLAENHHPQGFLKNATSKFQILEIACDLQAMSEEQGEATFEKYFKDIWQADNKRYFKPELWETTLIWMERALTCFKRLELLDDMDVLWPPEKILGSFKIELSPDVEHPRLHLPEEE
jgi:hypothetical protein